MHLMNRNLEKCKIPKFKNYENVKLTFYLISVEKYPFIPSIHYLFTSHIKIEKPFSHFVLAFIYFIYMSYYFYLLCIFIHKANVPKFSLVTYSPAVHLVCPQTKLLFVLFISFFFLYFSDYYDYIHKTHICINTNIMAITMYMLEQLQYLK